MRWGGLLCWESSAQKSAQNLRDSNCRRDCLSSELAHLFPSNVSVQLTNVTSDAFIILAQKHQFTVEPAFNHNPRFVEVEGRGSVTRPNCCWTSKAAAWRLGSLVRRCIESTLKKICLYSMLLHAQSTTSPSWSIYFRCQKSLHRALWPEDWKDRKPLQPVARTFILTERQIGSRLTLQVRILPPLESADLAPMISKRARIVS
jgi:hypothetical protein